MSKKFLSRVLIVSVAFQMIDENGIDGFSVRQLASKLGVQVSSLYNHIKNEYDLLMEVAKLSGAMYTDYISEKVSNLDIDEATYKAGFAFCDFVQEHPYLYEVMFDSRWHGDPEFDEAIKRFTTPIYVILQSYGVNNKEDMDHLFVAMRVLTHGFATLDQLGAFDKVCIDPKDTYRYMMKVVVDEMKNRSDKNDL